MIDTKSMILGGALMLGGLALAPILSDRLGDDLDPVSKNAPVDGRTVVEDLGCIHIDNLDK